MKLILQVPGPRIWNLRFLNQKIASLSSSSEFVGMVADDPHEKIKLKIFHAEIVNDNEKLSAESKRFKEIPVISNVTHEQVMENYHQVKLILKKLLGKRLADLRQKRGGKGNNGIIKSFLDVQ